MKTEDSTDISEFTVMELHFLLSLALHPSSENNDLASLCRPFTMYQINVSKLTCEFQSGKQST